MKQEVRSVVERVELDANQSTDGMEMGWKRCDGMIRGSGDGTLEMKLGRCG